MLHTIQSRFRSLRCFLWLLSLLCAGCFAPSASAASCTADSGGNFAIAAGTRIIPRDVGIGSIVIPKIGSYPAYAVSCQGDSSAAVNALVTFSASVAPVSGFTDVYPTNIAGLGVKYHFATNSGNGCNIPFDQTIPNASYTITCAIPKGGSLAWSWGTSIEFVKTGDIKPGTLSSIPAVTMSYTLSNGGGGALRIMYTGVATGQINVPTCTIPDTQVNLGTHTGSELSTTGAVTQAVGFAIALNACPGSMTSVKYRIDPLTSVIDSTQSVVQLSSDSTARGIGVQLLGNDGSTPFALSVNQAVAGYNLTSGGSYSIPLKARYYRLALPIASGAANASMTITLTYQ